MSTRYRLILPRSMYHLIIDQAHREFPNECCGLVAGIPNRDTVRAERLFPLTNAAEFPAVEFLSEPRGRFEADRAIRSAGLEIVAIYHSHPTSPPVPSRKDRERNFSPDIMNLIIGLHDGQTEVRAWWLWNEGYESGKWGFAEDDGVEPN